MRRIQHILDNFSPDEATVLLVLGLLGFTATLIGIVGIVTIVTGGAVEHPTYNIIAAAHVRYLERPGSYIYFVALFVGYFSLQLASLRARY